MDNLSMEFYRVKQKQKNVRNWALVFPGHPIPLQDRDILRNDTAIR